MGWGNHDYFWMMGWMGWIVMALFWVTVIIGIIVVIRHFAREGMGSAPSETRRRDPLEILRERYARGEIDTPEFEERVKTLGKKL